MAFQIDNETGLPQYSIPRIFTDYNKHTLSVFRRWLEEKHTIAELSNLLGIKIKDFDEVPIPTLDSPFQLKQIWYDFVEDYLIQYLEELKKIYESALGENYDYFLNVPYIGSWPDSHVKKRNVAPIGFDVYTKFTSGSNLDDFPFTFSFVVNYFLALNQAGFAFSPEMQAGWFDPVTVVSSDQTMFLGAVSYFFGTKYLSWYMLHDCIEPDGTPWIWNSFLDLKGQPTSRFKVLKQLSTLVSKTEELIKKTVLIRDKVALLTYSPYGREFFEGAFAGDIKARLINTQAVLGLSGLYGLLVDSNILPEVKILDITSSEELRKYKAVFFISLGYIDSESCKKLYSYVKGGGTLIIFGLPF